MNTHSSMADGRMEIIAAWAGACGVGETTVRQVLESITVEQALDLLEQEGILKPVMEKIMNRIEFYLKKRAQGSFQAEAVLFTNQKGVLGMTEGAGSLLETFRS